MYVPLSHYWNLLVTYLKPQRLRVLLLAVLVLSAIGLQLVNPQLLRAFIDTAQTGGGMNTLVLLALIFIGVALVQQITSVGATYVGETVGWAATNALRRDVALHCLQLDMTFHNTHTPGELLERIDGDITTLANFFSQFVIRIAGNALLLVGVLVLLFREDWRIGAPFTALVLLALIVLNKMRSLAEPYWVIGRQTSADLASFLEERLAGTEDIRSSGAEAYKLRRLFIVMRNLTQAYRKARVMSMVAGVVTRGIFALAVAAGLALGGYLYTQNAITIGTVVLITFYAQALAHPLQQIGNELQDWQQAGASIERVEALRRTPPLVQDGPGVDLSEGPLSVELDHVSFSYGEAALVLDDVSFHLPPGSTLGVLGRTGSGKTTITRLLFRFYDPQHGVVRLDGADLRHATQAQVRQRIGLVTQDVQLFHASVRDNVTLFNRSIADARILDALATLGLMSWLAQLPAGLDTMLDGGSGLSAGEAQMLAFTRVFLHDPGLVILDEASSRLDPATERLLERAVDRLLRGRTAIIVAHRLQTVGRADAILVLQDGRIAEYGARDALACDPQSRFAQLLRTGLEEVLA